jgi:hypothetical protein
MYVKGQSGVIIRVSCTVLMLGDFNRLIGLAGWGWLYIFLITSLLLMKLICDQSIIT